jgi:hypothetical protein
MPLLRNCFKAAFRGRPRQNARNQFHGGCGRNLAFVRSGRVRRFEGWRDLGDCGNAGRRLISYFEYAVRETQPLAIAIALEPGLAGVAVRGLAEGWLGNGLFAEIALGPPPFNEPELKSVNCFLQVFYYLFGAGLGRVVRVMLVQGVDGLERGTGPDGGAFKGGAAGADELPVGSLEPAWAGVGGFFLLFEIQDCGIQELLHAFRSLLAAHGRLHLLKFD